MNTLVIQYYRNSESAEVSEAQIAFKANKPTDGSFCQKNPGNLYVRKKFLDVFLG